MKACVARFLEDTGVIRCGTPDIKWQSEEDMLSVKKVQENAKSGYCKHCGSLKTAVERKLFFNERKLG